jgi:Ca-activated chloride channel family protein
MRFFTLLLFTLSTVNFIGGSAIEAFAQGATPAQPGSYSESTPYRPRQLPTPKPKSKKKSKQANSPSPQPEAQTPAPAANTAPAILEKPFLIPVSVFDSKGNFVSDLKTSDFQVFIDNNEVKISAMETRNEPVNLVLVIDRSPSAEFSTERIQKIAESVVGQLRPQDRVMVVTFALDTQVTTEFTDDREKIRKAIKITNFADGTSLYDAVRYLFEEKLNKVDGRTAIVLFTDGVDSTSRTGYGESLVYAEKSDVTIFPVYFDTSKNMMMGRQNTRLPSGIDSVLATIPLAPLGAAAERIKNAYDTGKFYLNDLVLLSGGRMIGAENFKEKGRAGIGEELRIQYLITVAPGTTARPGQRKGVRVRVNRPNLTVRARGSYIVGEK